MNTNLFWVWSSAIATIIAPALTTTTTHADPVERMCPNHGLVVGTVAARTLGPKGTLVELATALGKRAATEEEAVTVLCPASSRDTCNAGMKAFATVHTAGADGALNIYVRTGKDGSGPWVAFDGVAPAEADGMSTSIAGPNYLDGGRYVHFSIAEAHTVWAQQEGELDSERFGVRVVDIVIDREKGRHAWSQSALRWGTDVDCDAHVAPTATATEFSRSDCRGEVRRFNASDVAACTPAAHAVWVQIMADVLAKKKADAMTRLVGRPLASANTPDELVQRGRKLTKEKNYDAAIVAFNDAYDADNNLAEAMSGLGYAELLRAKGDDLDNAIEHLTEAYSSDSRGPGKDPKKFRSAVAFNLGLAHEKLGNTDTALEHFEDANRLNPSDAAKTKIKSLKAK